MSNSLRVLLALTLLSASACVRSLDPFCPAEKGKPRPELNGTWFETDRVGEPEPGKRVVIADGLVSTTNDAERIGGQLGVTYFQAGNVWFADSQPREMKGGPDGWWLIHKADAHHLCRVDLAGDTLKLTPLDQDWLRACLNRDDPIVDGVHMTHPGQNLFNARPAAWQKLLAAAAADPNAFPAARTVTLKRSAAGAP